MPTAGSQLIDAGQSCGDLGLTDALGNPRIIGASCDIGGVARPDVSSTQPSAENDAPSLTAFPNPTLGFVNLSLGSPVDKTSTPSSIQLLNAAGQTVYEGLYAIDGSGSLYLPLTHLPAGLYQVAVRVDDHLLTTRFTIQ